MKTVSQFLVASTLLFSASFAQADTAAVGSPAPDFKLEGGDGKTHSLADYKGKTVVIEWTNPSCPFVKKWYGSGSMQKLQKDATSKGVVWLRINSGAAGKEGFQTKTEIASYDQANHVAATESLVDPSGKVGHLYGARTTPHMFIVDSKGKLDYAGGIDSKASADPADIPTAKNYVTAALAELAESKPVSVATAPPYGCGVKYGDK